MGSKRIFTFSIYKKAGVLIAVLFLLSFAACKTKQDSSALPPRIIFLNYNITKEAEGAVNIEFINTVITEGKLKEETSDDKNSKNGDLRLLQVNAKLEPLHSITVSNPLVKNVEYLDESGAFQRKIIDLESAEFSVRTQLNYQTKFIIIEEINKENKPLIKTKL